MRGRTLVGGVGLGVLMLAALTLAGSYSAFSARGPVPEAELNKPIEPGTLSASQPRPEPAVPRPIDLPGGSPGATPRRLPQPERCSLILDPGNLVRDIRAEEAAGQASTTLQRTTRVSQLLTTFARGDAASATLRGIPRVLRDCKDFQAILDDGTPVRVHVGRLTRAAPGWSDPRARLGVCLGCGWL